MRYLLFLLLFPIASVAQTYSLAIPEYQTKLYKTPLEADYINGVNNVYSIIRNNHKLISLAIIDTMVNNRKGKWIRAIYHEMEGYIPYAHIKIKQSLNYVNSDNLLDYSREFQKVDDIYEAKLVEENKHQKIQDSISKVEYVKEVIKQGIAIVSCDFKESTYGNSVSFIPSIINYSKKTIKYIWFTLEFYNPVRDLIAKKTVQMVGPVYENASATFIFDNILYTKVFGYGEVTGAKILYMDGTTKTLNEGTVFYLIHNALISN